MAMCTCAEAWWADRCCAPVQCSARGAARRGGIVQQQGKRPGLAIEQMLRGNMLLHRGQLHFLPHLQAHSSRADAVPRRTMNLQPHAAAATAEASLSVSAGSSSVQRAHAHAPAHACMLFTSSHTDSLNSSVLSRPLHSPSSHSSHPPRRSQCGRTWPQGQATPGWLAT